MSRRDAALSQMSAPREIYELVQRFASIADRPRAAGRDQAYVRQEFVAPLFSALGWDMTDRGPDVAYVVHEYANRAGRPVRGPDYSFHGAGELAFFVLVRNPSLGPEDEPSPAYQLRRFAWSARLSLSIVTDFAEFAVYDCRQRPDRHDGADVARIHHLTCDQYADSWDGIFGLFSRESVEAGRLASHIAHLGKGRGAVTVEEAFLGEIETWRTQLASAMVGDNPGISEAALNGAVQRTIDRIVFLRLAEDRGMEPYQQLRGVAAGDEVYPHLLGLYRRAAARYHSGLFAVQPETRPARNSSLMPRALRIDARPLRAIIEALYYPGCPYQFSVLPTEILGNVYEQFLGKTIRIRGSAVTVENKPGQRKSGGVYYTPGYIVDHIVRRTLGRALVGKTPGQIARLRVVDPACGSGSFLLRALQYLFTWHVEQYLQFSPLGRRERLYQTAGGDWRLTIDERKRIVKAHIYGVDIDPQAVEITKLSLLLKVLEGISDLPLAGLVPLLPDLVLPDLDDNIKCGNSLIESDFHDRPDAAAMPREVTGDVSPVNTFDWRAGFPGISGFDVVIGNPPWGQKGITEALPVRAYLRERYPSAAGIFDLFRPFVERGIELVRPGGHIGMVLPDIVLLKNYQKTRQLMLDSLAITSIDWWAMPFANVVIDATTIVGEKRVCPDGHRVLVHVRAPDAPLRHEILQADFRANPRCVFNLHMTPRRRALVARLASWPALGEYFEVHEGVHSGNMRNVLFVGDRVDDTCQPLYFGRDEIVPYGLFWRGRYIRLSAASRKGQKKADGSGAACYANLGQPAWFTRDKLLLRRTGDRVLAARDGAGYYASNNFFVALVARDSALDLDGLCALLNSRFLTWYFRTVEPRQGRVFAELKIKHVNAFPLPRQVGQTRTPVAYRQLNELGQRRRQLAGEMAQANNDIDRESHQRRCAAMDGDIDALVCRLYELSDDELELLPRPVADTDADC